MATRCNSSISWGQKYTYTVSGLDPVTTARSIQIYLTDNSDVFCLLKQEIFTVTNGHNITLSSVSSNILSCFT